MTPNAALQPQDTRARPTARVFKYRRPELPEGPMVGKHVTRLARTDRMMANLQVLKSGGETNLHAHRHLDGFWMVMAGRARFYGENDVLVADLGPMEGVLIPRNFRYWFEASGDEPLEILQVESFDMALPDDKAVRSDRTDFTPQAAATRNIQIVEGRVDSPDHGRVIDKLDLSKL